jgi:hypothetical protein
MTVCDNPLLFPADGDFLVVDVELSLSLWETAPDEQLKPLRPDDSSPTR